MEFPLISTKVEEVVKSFDLDSPAGRHDYFHTKAQKEIEFIKEYLDRGNTIVTFWLAKKGAGKGTYSKMFAEIIGEKRLAHISVGDIVRHVHAALEDEAKHRELVTFLEAHYRGPLSIERAIQALVGRDIKTLLPTEFILALIKRELQSVGDTGLMIDGFPRGLDQISYSLYFREIMSLRDDPDFFVLVDVADSILDARIRRRVVCPICQLSRNTGTLITKEVEYDKDEQTYYLICDNPSCSGVGTQRLMPKEGGNLGIDGIRERLEADHQLIEYAANLQGVKKIYIQNSYPVDIAFDYVDDYEIAHEYAFSFNSDTQVVNVSKIPWVVSDNEGNDVYSITAAAGTLVFIKQLYENLK